MLSIRLLLFSALALAAPEWPYPPDPPPPLPGRFVRHDEMFKCPTLRKRPSPVTADDVRPDDFTVVMALGDSITAAFLAKDKRVGGIWHWDETKEGSESGEERFGVAYAPEAQTVLSPIAPFQEYRGVSYAIGGDEGAVTLPRLIGHYRNVSGASTGHHLPVTCGGAIGVGVCMPHSDEDKLNAAISGSVASALLTQVTEYLMPTYEEMEKEDGWAFLNIGIGANDICAFCLSSDIPLGPGTAEEFAKGIRHAVQVVRNHVPKLIVNIVGLFRVSAIYKLIHNEPYCQGPFLPPSIPVPNLPLECSCAFLPGPVGDYTRARMDDLSDAYDRAVLDLIRQWDDEDDPGFAAIWQPGAAIDLANYPIQAVSSVDCFHPSEAAHRRLAAGMWNRLTLSMANKATPISWEDEIYVRCLEEDDRIRVGQL